MRIVKVGVLAPTNKGILLGVQGENRATEVEFDTRPWFREYPSGTMSAVAKREGDHAPYPLSLDVADGTAVWQVSDTDTAKAGEGKVELTMTSGGVRVRSLTFKTLVTASLTDAPVDDDAWYGWLDKAVVKVDETVQSAQRKMDEVDAEWTTLKADVTAKVEECGDAAAQAVDDAHHAKVDAQATAKALESAEGSVAKAEAAVTRAEGAAEQAYGAINVISPKTIVEGATAPSLSFSAGYGASCSENANYSVAIGNMAEVSEIGSIAIGSAAISSMSGAVALGDNAKVNHRNSAAIASHSETTKENEFSIGSADYAGGEYTREITHVSTPTADTSASTKKYTDDNDAKTLTEAKKYTDENTSNALVGNVSGKLLHVEDAWPGKPLSLTIDGAYKQDGTPSPESPAPIVVVEHPVLWVTGKNLQKYPFPYSHPKVDNLNGVVVTDNGDGSVTATGTPSIESYYNFDFTSDFKFARGADVVVAAASNPSYHVEVITDDGNVPVINSITRLTNKVPDDALKTRSFLVLTAGVNHNVTVFPQFEIGTTATAYAPYVGTSLPITLPAEHPYLAALPDGTHDEIVIDNDGNVTLVARVAKVVGAKFQLVGRASELDNTNGVSIYGNLFNSDYTVKISGIPKSAGAAYCDKLYSAKDGSEKVTNAVYKPHNDTIVVNIAGAKDEEDAKAKFNALESTVYAPSTTETRYPLGKVTVPSLPDSISNVWTDAELTTNMSMTYKRDINIAFDNLVQAVVAATAGE